MTKPPDIAGLMKALENHLHDDEMLRHGEFYHWRDGIMPAVRRLARAVEEQTIERAAESIKNAGDADDAADAIRALPRLTEEP